MPVTTLRRQHRFGLAILAVVWVAVVIFAVLVFGERFIGRDASPSALIARLAESQ